jgi:sulfur carrier protein
MTRMRVNGAEVEVSVMTVADLLLDRGVDPTARFLAVAVNGTVVRRSEWPSKLLAPEDDIEIVRPFSGG